MTSTPTREQRIAEIRARVEKATKGPWDVWPGPQYVGGGADLCIGSGGREWMANMDHAHCRNYAHHIGCHDEGCKLDKEENVCSFDDAITGKQQANADFIAHAREDVPFLLTTLRETQAQLAAAQEELDRLQDRLGTLDGALILVRQSRDRAIAERDLLRRCVDRVGAILSEGGK